MTFKNLSLEVKMVKISNQELQEGKKIVQLVSQCSNALDCLWGGKECNKNCKLSFFRRVFERNSPAFYGLYRKLSNYDSISSNLHLAELEGNSDQQYEAYEALYDFQLFAQASVLLLYPLFLANNEDIPFVNMKEMEEVERTYLKFTSDLDSGILLSRKARKEREKRNNEIKKINPEWWNFFAMISSNFCEPEIYAKKCYLVFKIFLRGIEKYSPPKRFVSEIEKEEFFQEIEKFLFLKTR